MSGAPARAYVNDRFEKAQQVFLSHGLSLMIPHYIYRKAFPLYDEIYILLAHMLVLYHRQGKPVQRLKQASTRYTDWLDQEKRKVYRSRKRSFTEVNGMLHTMACSDGLANLLANEKLAAFLKKVIVGREIFDYRDLSLKPESEL